MTKFPLEDESNETNVANYIEMLKNLSALKVSKILDEFNVFDSMQRPRSPEEIYHFHNFTELNVEFTYIFELLADAKLLSKQGEFFKENDRRNIIEKELQEEINATKNTLIEPFEYIFDKTIKRYISILGGEYGKLKDTDLTDLLDNIYGSEFYFLLRELWFKNMTTRLPIFSDVSSINMYNWGIGSGYEAVHMADFFGNRVSVTSIEPENASYKGQVLQDLYEVYNLSFVEQKNLNVSKIENSVDVFVGNGLLFFGDFKEKMDFIQRILKPEGYLAFILCSPLDLALKWVFSIYKGYNGEQKKDEIIAKLKHYGFSRMKYIGLYDSFVLFQKS